MKQNLKTILFAATLFVIGFAGQAQQKETQSLPRWISDKGYWVVESNIHVPRQYTIHFYNNDNEEIYKEKVIGIKLKLNKRKTLLQMKSVLESAVYAWEQKQPLDQNGNFFVAAVQKR